MNVIYKILLSLLTISSDNAFADNFKPNIVIFLSDDLGSYDVGFHGSRHLSTPNIDSLAADGIVLNRYYSQPLCSPSRGALLTGIHPIHSGTQNYVLLSGSPWGLPLRHKLLPQYLKDLGYKTHAIGKWHLGFYRRQYVPTSRGFDTHSGYWTSAEDYYSHWSSERGLSGLDFRDNLNVVHNADGIYSTDFFTDKAIEVIERHNGSQPLFLYMAYQSVHSANKGLELQAPKELIDKFDYIEDLNRRLFAAMLYSMDLSIGRIVRQLDSNRLLNNTIIIFLSDNGGAISGLMENSASNYPLRGTKAGLWEGGVRVPAFIWSPRLKYSGYVSENYIQVIDWIPTLLEAVDKNYAKNIPEVFDGNSVWNTLNEKMCQKNNELLLNVDPVWNTSSIISNDWKLIQGSVPRNVSPEPDLWSQSYETKYFDFWLNKRLNKERIESNVYRVLKKMKRKVNFNQLKQSVIDCGLHSTVTECNPNQLCLFDLISDPCEYNNLAKSYPKIVEKLWNKILEYNKTSVPPLNQPIDPNSDPIYNNNVWESWR